MRLIPQSLLWRTFLLIALLLGLSVTAWLQIFRLYEREPRSVQIANQIAAIVNLTRAALISSKPESRSYLLGEISESERIEIYLVEPTEALEPLPQRPVIRRIEELLREKIGERTRFASSRNGLPGFWVSFSIDDDEYWVRLRADRIDATPPLQWVGWGVASLLPYRLARLPCATSCSIFPKARTCTSTSPARSMPRPSSATPATRACAWTRPRSNLPSRPARPHSHLPRRRLTINSFTTN